jgi:hypothetical protein
MDAETLSHWREVIKRILRDLVAIPYPDVVNLKAKTVFDDVSTSYLVVVEGWKDVKRLHGCIVHVEIKDSKIWIQQDGTEDGIAGDLLRAGISKENIVLGFKSPQSRKYTGFAVA